MYICSNNHEEIVHEGRDCPVCRLIEDYEESIKEKDEYIEELEDENQRLQEIHEEVKQHYPEFAI